MRPFVNKANLTMCCDIWGFPGPFRTAWVMHGLQMLAPNPKIASKMVSFGQLSGKGQDNSYIDETIERYFAEGSFCTNQPIDAVYTWVNGTDPSFMKTLDHYAKTGT